MKEKIIILLSVITFVFCQGNERFVMGTSAKEVVENLSKAEKEGNVLTLSNLFSDDIIFLPEVGPPVFGKKAVIDLYKFVFNKFDYDPEYLIRDITIKKDFISVDGKCISKAFSKSGNLIREDTLKFILEIEKDKDQLLINKMLLGEETSIENRIPSLPEPEGKFKVGRRDFLLKDSSRFDPIVNTRDSLRPVAFQIWYPSKADKEEKISYYQSKEVIEKAAEFYGWPLFFNNYQQFLKTNTYLNSEILSGKGKFPVIFYNHGYSGFSSVHQTLFEELASKGFVIVSVGHAYESSLFIKPDGEVISFSNTNRIFSEVNNESHSGEIESAKDQILNARNFSDKLKAYKKLIDKSEANNNSTRVWTEDCLFVLAKLGEINREIFSNMLDLNNCGAIGHSLGGATAGQLIISDQRLKAGINLDGFQFGDLINSKLNKPFMFFGQANNINDLFLKLSAADCYAVSVAGFQHSTFTDQPLFQSVWNTGQLNPNGVRALEIQREIAAGFFEKYLHNKKNDLVKSAGQYNEVQIETNCE